MSAGNYPSVSVMDNVTFEMAQHRIWFCWIKRRHRHNQDHDRIGQTMIGVCLDCGGLTVINDPEPPVFE